jgi:hypothetical protein
MEYQLLADHHLIDIVAGFLHGTKGIDEEEGTNFHRKHIVVIDAPNLLVQDRRPQENLAEAPQALSRDAQKASPQRSIRNVEYKIIGETRGRHLVKLRREYKHLMGALE